MSRTDPPPELAGLSLETVRESPRHGFQGDRAPRPPRDEVPASLTIAISRESGSRGGTIARRVGQKLGWQVYHQELLEYIAQEGAFRDSVTANLSDAVARWSEQRLEQLLREQNLSQHPSVLSLARIILALGAQGEVVIIGRGAGCLLPLTETEAAEQVRLRDQQRTEFLTTHFHRQPGDIYQYDLLLNTSLLGEDQCAELIAQAARGKLNRLLAGEPG
jgi:hypothetical protein